MSTLKRDTYSPYIGEYMQTLKLVTFRQEQDRSFKVCTNSPILGEYMSTLKVDTFSPYRGEKVVNNGSRKTVLFALSPIFVEKKTIIGFQIGKMLFLHTSMMLPPSHLTGHSAGLFFCCRKEIFFSCASQFSTILT